MAKDQKLILDRLRRLEGQLKALERLIDEGEECDKVLTQFAAAKAAFQSLGVEVLVRAMQTCLDQKTRGLSEAEASSAASELLRQYVKHLQ